MLEPLLEPLLYCIAGGLIGGAVIECLICWTRKQAWRLDPEWREEGGIWGRRTTR